MMLSEHHRSNPNPTIHMPPWSVKEDPTADFYSSYYQEDNNNNNAGAGDFAGDYSPYHLREALAALQSYLPSNEIDGDSDSDAPVDAYSCDHFRMYEFKVRRCARGRSHDWTECPYAHPGEKARRRDPRKFHYSGAACPDFRKGNCKKGDGCEFAHGVFECWLHPARYRTQPCKDGTSCRRRVCFFAHTPEQLRQAPQPSQHSPRCINSPDSYDGSPLRQISVPFMSSPANGAVSVSLSPPMSPPAESPPMSPMSPMLSRSLGSSVNEMVVSLRNLQLGKVKSLPMNRNVSVGSPGFGSPRGSGSGSVLRPGFCSLPNTPTQAPGSGRSGVGYFDLWDQTCEEEPMMERVESGRDIRAKMFEKLSKENSLGSSNPDPGLGGAPDFEWVSDLVT